MKIVIDVKESKTSFLLELLESLSFVNSTEKIRDGKAENIRGFKNSLKAVKLHMEGKIKLQSARDLLEEL